MNIPFTRSVSVLKTGLFSLHYKGPPTLVSLHQKIPLHRKNQNSFLHSIKFCIFFPDFPFSKFDYITKILSTTSVNRSVYHLCGGVGGVFDRAG